MEVILYSFRRTPSVEVPVTMLLQALAIRKLKKDDKIRTEYIRREILMISHLRYSFGMCLWHIPNLILSSFFHQLLAKYPANALNQALLHLTVRENIRRIAGSVAPREVVEKAR